MIEADGLSKWYGPVMGLNDVSVKIEGGVTGLLGPNGAGKTTFLRLMTGQIKPSQGRILLAGQPVWNNRRALSRIGFCPEEDAFYEHLSALEFVTALGRISGLGAKTARERAGWALERTGMTQHMHRRIRGFSKGMRQRTKFAQAIVHDPDILFLDEPLTGADPVGRRHLRELIGGLAEEGKQVVVSSHVLHEVESLTESIVLIHRGRVVATGNVHEIRSLMDDYPHRVRLRCDRPREFAAALVGLPYVSAVELTDEDDRVVAQTSDPGAFFDAMPEMILDRGLTVHEMYSEDDNLDAVFRYLVQR